MIVHPHILSPVVNIRLSILSEFQQTLSLSTDPSLLLSQWTDNTVDGSLMTLLEDEDAQVRIQAIQLLTTALIQIDQRQEVNVQAKNKDVYVQMLMDMLVDPSVHVMRTCIESVQVLLQHGISLKAKQWGLLFTTLPHPQLSASMLSLIASMEKPVLRKHWSDIVRILDSTTVPLRPIVEALAGPLLEVTSTR